MRKVLSIVLISIILLFLLWVVVSYVDIIADNLSMNPEHYSWNLFVLIQ